MDDNTNNESVVPQQVAPQKHFLAVFFISFMWGTFGVDRFYLGKWGTGLLKLISFGGFGFWTLIDLAIIMTGGMRDKQGRELLQFAEYKKFANKTVLIFAIVLGLSILVIGLLSILGLYVLVTSLLDGGMLDALPGGLDVEQLQGGGVQDQLDALDY
jgi:TM2 domain-containing membrane protein YozV